MIRFLSVIVLVSCVGHIQVNAGIIISEIAPSGAAGQPAYIELTVTQPVTSLELLILNGDPFREKEIKERVPFTVDRGVSIIVIHEGTWVGPAAFDARLIPRTSLELTDAGPFSARRLALFDTSDGPTVGPNVPELSQWNTTLTLPPLLDAVTYSINGKEANDSLGEPLLEMATDEAAVRTRSTTGFTDIFDAGPLSPGIINALIEIPEPSTGVFAFLMAFVMRRR